MGAAELKEGGICTRAASLSGLFKTVSARWMLYFDANEARENVQRLARAAERQKRAGEM